MNHQGTNTLDAERLILRRFMIEDAEGFFQNVTSDPEVNRFLTWSLDESVEDTKKLLSGWIERYENQERYCWAIVLKETGDVIGTIAAPTVKNRVEAVEVTYCIGSRWWGQGIVPEALQAVMKYLFEEVQVNRIEAGFDSNNPNSGRVMEKVGMQREGFLRQAGRNNQGLFDLVFYSILKDDWIAIQKGESMTKLRKDIAEMIRLSLPREASDITYEVLDSVKEEGYTRHLISYMSNGDKVSAFLLLPDKLEHNPAILINHQHNREHHLGKSEVCGLAGNPLQAFGSELAKQGFVVLAPDSICFEERRKDPTVEGFDFGQHFQEMCYRVITGEFLMKRVLTDAMNGVSLLTSLPFVDADRIGTLGHSYGGNTVLFLSALDDRISFACASGSACSFEYRMKHGTGIEMASVIPNFHGKYDIDDLVALTAPRKLLLVSSDEDKYSMDAPEIVEKAGKTYAGLGVAQNLNHKRYSGGHGLTKERFRDIIEWIVLNA